MENQTTFYDLIDRLRVLIKARLNNGDYTERSLARALQVSQPHLHNMLKGIRRMSLEFSDQAMKEFRISVKDLMQDDGESQQSVAETQRKPVAGSTKRNGESRSSWQGTDKRHIA